MQNFVKNVIQPPIRNILDLLESKMDTLKKYLIDKMDQLEKYLIDKMDTLEKYLINFVNTAIAELRQEFIEFKNYVISLFDYRPEFPIGYIGNYYGKLDNSNTHPVIDDKIYLDWYVCDGRNGTIDLRDKFVIGANGNFENELGTGSHSHRISVSIGGGISGTALTTSNLPPHTHRLSDRHTGVGPLASDKWPGAGRAPVAASIYLTGAECKCDLHTTYYYTYGDLTYHNTESTGSGTSHTHNHSLYASASSGTTSNIPPCMALYYIMYKKQI